MSGRLGVGTSLPCEVHLPPIEGGGKRCDDRAKVVPPARSTPFDRAQDMLRVASG